ncbi:DUF2515 family protein [Cohnella terricola]|uniref:DUF2515 domain-containing protein n=1 Tax=Cohnella terricola TaxID=1289167 RepID=A0A559JFS6_9BACL|nr:DUF2515 family protein [Cohnella terricola]TVX98734.1 DUF2515 domain-containing protein [Cohnella terricola]
MIWRRCFTIGTITNLLRGLRGKADGLWHSYRLTRGRITLGCDADPAGDLAGNLHKAIHALPRLPTTTDDERICETIRRDTAACNRNNVTRTAAYWSMYRSCPELHWAFLAHLVSRNGGWNMTDLRGQWLPQLMDENLIVASFDFLEASNSFIFGDAYPQLMLYAESKRTGRNLFALLPRFGVSSFMAPFWNRFWVDRNPVPLTEALIVNEQHYIQSRVIENDGFRKSVIDSLPYRIQPYLQSNQAIIPLWRKGYAGSAVPMRLAGRVLERFEDLRERIEFGKSLYRLLFSYPRVLRAAAAFARHVPHTGSRADYWPHRFAPSKNGGTSAESDIAAVGSRSSLWLSPALTEAWPDRKLPTSRERDWFGDPEEALSFLRPIRPPLVIDMTHEHLFCQYKLQSAALLERSFINGANKRRTGLG